MTFYLLDHVIKVTFEQRTKNNAIVYVLLSLVKVPSIAPLTVIYIVYKLSQLSNFFLALTKIIVERMHSLHSRPYILRITRVFKYPTPRLGKEQ